MDSHLKKEFDSKAVNRVRNIVNKDYGKRTSTGTGYEKKREKHKEGDIWEEDGRTWTIKNGVRQNITKLDDAKKAYQVPLTCPKCGGPMKHWLAKKMYKIHGFCFDPCTIEMEANLKKAGLYEEYERKLMQGNMKAWANDLEQWLVDQLKENVTFVTEDGTVEDWSADDKNKATLARNVNQYLHYLKKHME